MHVMNHVTWESTPEVKLKTDIKIGVSIAHNILKIVKVFHMLSYNKVIQLLCPVLAP